MTYIEITDGILIGYMSFVCRLEVIICIISVHEHTHRRIYVYLLKHSNTCKHAHRYTHTYTQTHTDTDKHIKHTHTFIITHTVVLITAHHFHMRAHTFRVHASFTKTYMRPSTYKDRCVFRYLHQSLCLFGLLFIILFLQFPLLGKKKKKMVQCAKS